MMRPLFTLLILLLSFSTNIFGQDIRIKINAPEKVMVGEQFRVAYIVESNKEMVKESIVIKNMENFEIIHGPSISTSSSSVFKNGKRETTYSTISSYFIEAQKAGKFILPSAELKINDKRYKSESVKIEVSSSENNGKEIDAFVRTSVSKSSVNISDTLTLVYRLCTTKSMERAVRYDFPTLNDFYIRRSIQSQQPFTEEVIDGKKYLVIELRRLILQPKTMGLKTIPEGEIVIEYATPTGKKVRDFWGDVYDEVIRTEKVLPIEPFIIRVQDLKEI